MSSEELDAAAQEAAGAAGLNLEDVNLAEEYLLSAAAGAASATLSARTSNTQAATASLAEFAAPSQFQTILTSEEILGMDESAVDAAMQEYAGRVAECRKKLAAARAELAQREGGRAL